MAICTVLALTEGFSTQDIVTNVQTIMSMGTTTLTTLLANPIMAFIFSVGFVGLGFSVIRKMIRTAKTT